MPAHIPSFCCLSLGAIVNNPIFVKPHRGLILADHCYCPWSISRTTTPFHLHSTQYCPVPAEFAGCREEYLSLYPPSHCARLYVDFPHSCLHAAQSGAAYPAVCCWDQNGAAGEHLPSYCAEHVNLKLIFFRVNLDVYTMCSEISSDLLPGHAPYIFPSSPR